MLHAAVNQSNPVPSVVCTSTHLSNLLWTSTDFTWDSTNGGSWNRDETLGAATRVLGPPQGGWNTASVRPTQMNISINIDHSSGMTFPTTIVVTVKDTSANVLGTANIVVTSTGPFSQSVTLNWGGSGGGDALNTIEFSPGAYTDGPRITCIQFVGVDAPILDRRVDIPVDTHYYNLNLKDYYESLYPPAVAGDYIIMNIPADTVKVGSVSHTLPALDTGTWASGVNLTVWCLSDNIKGAGSPGATSPARGGTAFKVRVPINLFYTEGTFAGGGGGGATTNSQNGITGGLCPSVANTYKSGGGGGAGDIPGAGDTPTGVNVAYNGQAGGSASGGLGGNPYSDPCQPAAGCFGGAGGNLGSAGSNSSDGNTGGAAGYSIEGIANVTTIGVAGTLIGPTV